MKKKLIVTNIDDFLIKHKAFVEPHKDWFDRAIKKTKDNSLAKWKNKKDYFIGVNLAMDKIMPKATKNKKTAQARTWYQQDVIKYIKNNPKVVNKKTAEKLKSLKENYKIILLTTNTKDYINKILKAAKLTKIYDGIIPSVTSKEPNKKDLINKLVKKYGKPKYYITNKKELETEKEFKKLKTKIISSKQLGTI